MRRTSLPVSLSALVVLFVLLVGPVHASAQTADAVGIRAQGMAGAFTAVADDATATWWNPAGLAAGPYANVVLEYGRPRDEDASHRGFAFAFPALGLSYYRLSVSEIQPIGSSTGSSTASRQDPGTGAVRSLELSQFGATFGQSVGGHLVMASTLKLLRAGGDTEGDLDIGAMAMAGLIRLGVMVRNVREPSFGDGDAAMTLRRQVRAGVAVTTVSGSAFGGATIAADVDLKAVSTASGDERRVGVGGEIWAPQRTVGARAGISASTIGDRRTAPAVGGSVALHRGIYVDGQFTGGSDATRHGWGAALRMTF